MLVSFAEKGFAAAIDARIEDGLTDLGVIEIAGAVVRGGGSLLAQWLASLLLLLLLHQLQLEHAPRQVVCSA